MNNLNKYLDKFKVIKLADSEVKEVAAEVIFRLAGIALEPKQLRLNSFNLYLDLKPAERNVVFMKREKILAELRQVLDKKAPKAIL